MDGIRVNEWVVYTSNGFVWIIEWRIRQCMMGSVVELSSFYFFNLVGVCDAQMGN